LKPTIASQSWVFDFLETFETFDRSMRITNRMRNKTDSRNKPFKPRFGPQTRFEIAPIAPVPFRGTAENDLEQLKARLLGHLLEQPMELELNTALRRAASDAASAAWFTPFPLLFFPTLLEEKATTARLRVQRQQEIRQRTQGLLEQVLSE
jgi:hypothetical protein